MVTTQTAIPLQDVKITITDGETLNTLERTYLTDESGQTVNIPLETVSREYSFDRDNTTVLPYHNYNLCVEKEGFMKGEVIGVQIFDGEKSIQQIGLMPRPTEFGNDYERELYIGQVEKLFDVQPGLQEGISTYVLQRVTIPEYVTVHLGAPGSSAENVRIPFRTYLKSVAASEIYPTWPYQALKANILCQVTFILNRIYTEWYRSRGYSFDITNSTSYDQKYIHNRSTFESTDRVVEEVFNNYVTRAYNREPYFTEYCDGRQVTCSGLKQWGTVDRANEGYDALGILRYYYGRNIIVNETNYIESLPQSYPGTSLRRGSSGQNVAMLQAQLNRISDNYPAIPKETVDGIFGQRTEEAVKVFQRVFNLTQDGIVGKATWYKISYIYVAVKKLAELSSEGEALDPGAYPGYPIRRGDTGLNVLIIQFYINQAANYINSIYEVAMDGIFGSGLETQVRNFQRYFNLSADGVVGPATWDKMYRIWQSIEAGVTEPGEELPPQQQYPGTVLRVGSTGNNVRKIQQWLAGISQYYSTIPSLAVDGIFGNGTRASVVAFQNRFGLVADGLVGPATWNRIYNVWQNLVADNLI